MGGPRRRERFRLGERCLVDESGEEEVHERGESARGLRATLYDAGEGSGENGAVGQTDVSEQSERWRLIDWFVGGRIISRTRTRRLAFVYVRAYASRAEYARPRPRAEISNVAMSTGAARTDARTECVTVVRIRRARWNTV